MPWRPSALLMASDKRRLAIAGRAVHGGTTATSSPEEQPGRLSRMRRSRRIDR